MTIDICECKTLPYVRKMGLNNYLNLVMEKINKGGIKNALQRIKISQHLIDSYHFFFQLCICFCFLVFTKGFYNTTQSSPDSMQCFTISVFMSLTQRTKFYSTSKNRYHVLCVKYKISLHTIVVKYSSPSHGQ